MIVYVLIATVNKAIQAIYRDLDRAKAHPEQHFARRIDAGLAGWETVRVMYHWQFVDDDLGVVYELQRRVVR